MFLFWLVLLPILSSIVAYLNKRQLAGYLLGLTQLLLFLMALYTAFNVYTLGDIIYSFGDNTVSIGINLVADKINIIFILLSCIFFPIMLLFNYHKSYMNKLFLFLFLVLQGLINGIFLSNDLFNLYALIEVSTITVSILIMYKKTSHSIYDGILYLLINLVSMAFFLLGIGYIYKIFGTLDLTLIKQQLTHVTSIPGLILPYTLILTPIVLKSALLPLPRAHGTPSAPSIVSSVLSGIYVTSSLYLFIKIQDTFSSVINTGSLFLIFGFIISILGFILALSQTDIRLILTYSTISQVGLIVFGLSLASDYSYYGSIYHLLSHAVFKSTLFLTAGMIIEEYDTRDIRKIRGLFKRMPFVTIVICFALLGISGAPLFNGSISKYLIKKGSDSIQLLEYGLIIINIATMTYLMKYTSMFFGNSKKSKAPPWNQKIALILLASLCLLGGVGGQFFINWLFELNIQIEVLHYMEKFLVYFMSLGLGYLFYEYIYKKYPFFQTIRQLELSFNELILTITLFFTGLLSYLLLVH
ncbi:MAG: proton-conducting membrane transporter [Firmicutes bacterium HGW-Firmicutes-3]|jgi:multicomponent Na+:H+ antiporter subunit D|nr:MAG: proton-conducting membrane transporter [Firmicutes bacterium HGW-Firmicutes-3]